MYKNLFFSIWKSQGVSFKKAREELKFNFEVVDKVIFDKHVESFSKFENKPNKVHSQKTNLVVQE